MDQLMYAPLLPYPLLVQWARTSKKGVCVNILTATAWKCLADDTINALDFSRNLAGVIRHEEQVILVLCQGCLGTHNSKPLHWR